MIDKNQEDRQPWRVLVLILKKIADSKNIPLQEIARESGLKESNINRVFKLKYCPDLHTFISIANAVKVNFFFEDRESITNLNQIFEAAMTELGRRPGNLPKN
jgi:DNA-binding phage protein